MEGPGLKGWWQGCGFSRELHPCEAMWDPVSAIMHGFAKGHSTDAVPGHWGSVKEHVCFFAEDK